MINITDIKVLEEFTNDNRTYGKYFVKVNGQNKLIVCRTDEWCSIENYVDRPIKDCVSTITEEFRNALIKKLGN